jgi:D-arabinose 1-dehydrogenase-like Zn-dependent alcohol dehydrogenase
VPKGHLASGEVGWAHANAGAGSITALRETPARGGQTAKPHAQPGELLLRVCACAVCRTDLQLAEGHLPPRHLPIVTGYQVVGRVEAIGPGVDGSAPGNRAGVAWLGGACGQCDACRRGGENLCGEARFTGWAVTADSRN